MEIIKGTTRTVHIWKDTVYKYPGEKDPEEGCLSNIYEYQNSLLFPQFSAKTSICLEGVLNIQQRLEALQYHPKFDFYRKIRDRCINIKDGGSQCCGLWKSIENLGLKNQEEFESFFVGMRVSYIFQKHGIYKSLGKESGSSLHELLNDKNYGLNSNGKICLVDLGDKNLKNALKIFGDDIFGVLNQEINTTN